MPDQLKLRTVANITLTNSEVDTNFSSLFYTASMSGSFLVLSTTGSTTKTVTTTPINLGLGNQVIASGKWSHAQGYQTSASSQYSHAEGDLTRVVGYAAHSEGGYTFASGTYSHTEGYYTTASGDSSHAEGFSTRAVGPYSHAEGSQTIARGTGSHAEGESTLASASYSHAEGRSTIASGQYSHAEGSSSIAQGIASHAAGLHTIASGAYQSVIGEYNIPLLDEAAFIVGNGTSNTSRSNLIFASGSQIQLSGSLYVTSSAVTLGQFTGNQNGYVEFSVRNTNTGMSASGDIAVYADNGTTSNNYIDMGIHNSGMTSSYSYFGTDFGNALDAYVYNVGGNLRIGNATSLAPFSQSLFLFSNSTATPNIWITGSQVAIGKASGSINGTLDVNGNTTISGSFTITGSNTLIGTKTISGSVSITGSKTIIGDNIITGSLSISGSTTLKDILILVSRSTTPTQATTATGSIMLSGSSGALLSLYIYTGTGALGNGWSKITIS